MSALSPAFRRYLLLELPGWAVAGAAVWALTEYAGLDPWLAAGLLALWVAKDFALYPWLRHAYELGDPSPAAPLRGRTARVTERLAPRGYARLDTERWRAELERPEEGPAEEGEAVRVRGLEGLTLIVERVGVDPPPGDPLEGVGTNTDST